jgi:hypothetical protein
MQYRKHDVVAALRRAGFRAAAEEAMAELPDPVDSQRVAEWGMRRGITRDVLISRPGLATSCSPVAPPGGGYENRLARCSLGMAERAWGEFMKSIAASHEATYWGEPSVHNWRVSQLRRLGVPEAMAEIYADHVDWHQVAWLVRRGCPPPLAIRIMR